MKKRKIILTAFAVVILTSFTAIFKIRSWSEIPYHPADGQKMIKSLGERIDTYYPDAYLRDVLYYVGLKLDGNRVQICAVHIRSPLSPTWIRRLKVLGGSKKPVFDLRFRWIVHSPRGLSISNTLVGGQTINANSDWARRDYERCAAHVKSLEPNTTLRLNEDFVAISHHGTVRVYAMSRASDATKATIKELGIDDDTWKDLASN